VLAQDDTAWKLASPLLSLGVCNTVQHTLILTHTRTLTHTHTLTHTYLHTHRFVVPCILGFVQQLKGLTFQVQNGPTHAHTHTRTHTHTHTHTQTHTHTHTHTHAHTHTHVHKVHLLHSICGPTFYICTRDFGNKKSTFQYDCDSSRLSASLMMNIKHKQMYTARKDANTHAQALAHTNTHIYIYTRIRI